MPVLTRSASTSRMHIAVLSEPVPAVVGTAISGFSGWLGLLRALYEVTAQPGQDAGPGP